MTMLKSLIGMGVIFLAAGCGASHELVGRSAPFELIAFDDAFQHQEDWKMQSH